MPGKDKSNSGGRGEDLSDAFSELIRLCGEKAYNFAYRLAGNDPEARDLVQEAFVRAYEHFGGYDSSKPFEAWLFSILHNIYLDRVRRYERKNVVSLDASMPDDEGSWEEILPSQDPGPVVDLVRRESDYLIQQALRSLPVHYRTAVILCDIEGLSYDEIGRIMDCPVGTVRSRIHQGRQLVRRAYETLERMGGKLQ